MENLRPATAEPITAWSTFNCLEVLTEKEQLQVKGGSETETETAPVIVEDIIDH